MSKKTKKIDNLLYDKIDNNTDNNTDNNINNSKKNNLNIPWIEKYRPSKLDDIVIDKCTRNKIEKIINDKEMPNIIITGVPGIGKTTTILCIAKYLVGKYFKQAVLELNASDERGIKSVQKPITYFCKKKMDIKDEKNRTYAKHKIVLLDEADNMTKKAQQLINNLMETYDDTTRFAFTCNNSSDIIEAIQSRCIIFRYRRLGKEETISRLKNICELENVDYNDEGLEAIFTTSQGDMRKAINHLQLTFNGYNEVNTENVYKLCDKPHPMVIKDIFLSCYKNDIKKALEYLEILRDDGYSSSDISSSMINTLKSANIREIDERTKIKYMAEIGKTSLIIRRGVDTPLQLTGCVAKLCLL